VVSERHTVLSHRVRKHTVVAVKALPLRDPYILTSCLQKALRRGDGEAAGSAALSLLRLDSRRLWRRIAILTFEDFGLADLDLTRNNIAAASNKRWRETVGGDENVLSYLIGEMAACPRDRRVDNLYMLAVQLTRTPAGRSAFLASKASGPVADVVQRAVGLVSRCEHQIPNRSIRAVLAGPSNKALLQMRQSGWLTDDLLDTCMRGRRTSACVLPLLFPLVKVATEAVGVASHVVPSNVPEVRLIHGVPGYAIDGFTRFGKQALAELATANKAVRRVVSRLRESSRQKGLTYLLFEAEGGICTRELSDPFTSELKRHALGCWTGLPHGDVPEAIAVMRSAIPELNYIRQALTAQFLEFTQGGGPYS